MPSRANTSRCQGWTPSEAHPPVVAAPNNNSSSSSQSQDSGTTAQTQATSISNLLMSSANSRSQWNATTLVNNTGNCIGIDQDVAGFEIAVHDAALMGVSER